VSSRLLRQGLGLALALVAASSAAQAPAGPAASTPGASAQPRYTFGWPLDAGQPRPRGGSTRGVPVVLDREPSDAWRALRAPDLTARERDRRAILAMAGVYRVGFDFIEVASYAEVPPAARAPYQSWATEKVYVDRDEPGFVSLVHILEMHMLDRDGKPMAPMVTKHWRQDWRHEPDAIVEYRGRDRWERRALGEAERRGAWLQTVYQVDESPRYASIGRWEHSASFSTWLSGETWRPRPRREWSVRDDYQVLIGTNRHTIGPTGWLQEENNLKAVLTPQREVDPQRPYVGREYGLARYERLRDAAFAGADRYYERTRGFWNAVRGQWATAFAQQGTVTLKGPVDRLGLFMPLFERADAIEAGSASGDDAAVIRAALEQMGALAK
jgi:hypothetical protein